jgi:hypothetical protein
MALVAPSMLERTLDRFWTLKIQIRGIFPELRKLQKYLKSRGKIITYLFVFILAWYGFAEIYFSMSRFTDGMGMLEIPWSYNRFFRAFLALPLGLKLFRSICKVG